jgi:hypothetical protein
VNKSTKDALRRLQKDGAQPKEASPRDLDGLSATNAAQTPLGTLHVTRLPTFSSELRASPVKHAIMTRFNTPGRSNADTGQHPRLCQRDPCQSRPPSARLSRPRPRVSRRAGVRSMSSSSVSLISRRPAAQQERFCAILHISNPNNLERFTQIVLAFVQLIQNALALFGYGPCATRRVMKYGHAPNEADALCASSSSTPFYVSPTLSLQRHCVWPRISGRGHRPPGHPARDRRLLSVLLSSRLPRQLHRRPTSSTAHP